MLFSFVLVLMFAVLSLGLAAAFGCFLKHAWMRIRYGRPIPNQPLYWLAFFIIAFLLLRIQGASYVSDRVEESLHAKGFLDKTETGLVSYLVLFLIFAYFNKLLWASLVSPGKLLPAALAVFAVFIGFHAYYKAEPISMKCIDHATSEILCRKYELPDGEIKIELKDKPVPAYYADKGVPTREELYFYDRDLAAPEARRIFIGSKSACDNYSFFDGLGRPQVYYVKVGSGYELFDRPTRHPGTGQPSRAVTQEAAVRICSAVAVEEEAERQRKVAEQAAAARAEQARRLEQERRQKAEQTRRLEQERRQKAEEERQRKAGEERIRAERTEAERRLDAEREAAERSASAEQMRIRQQIEQSRPGLPSPFCLNVLRNENPTLTVILPDQQCLVNRNSAYCANAMLTRLGFWVAAQVADEGGRQPGCVAYQGSGPAEPHRQTLQCLVRILGPNYHAAPGCSSYRYGGNGYEIHHL